MIKKTARFATLATTAALAAVPGSQPARSLEQPTFATLDQSGHFEIRQYEAHLLASTFIEGEMREASNQGFRRLAGYIFGGNRSADGKPEKIAMTSPVNMVRSESGWVMTFMMPSAYEIDSLPIPKDSRVMIRPSDGGLYGAVRFSGIWSEKRFLDFRVELERFVAERGWQVAGEPVIARYDPPWKPFFLRRNEVLIPLEANDSISESP